MVNAVPGIMNARFSADELIIRENFLINKAKVNEVLITDSVIYIKPEPMKWHHAVALLQGTNIIELSKKEFYTMIDIGFYNLLLESKGASHYRYKPPGRFFNAYSIISGFQFVPAFCMGFGVSYNFYDIHVGSATIKNVSFMPLYADIRSHLPAKGKRANPYFKFNLGYSILMSRKYTYVEPANSYQDHYYYEMKRGGIIVSPGFGLRIIITDLVQLNTCLEYSFERSRLYYSIISGYSNPREFDMDLKFHFLRFKLGISFQY
jgi:hypothetical protein